MIAAEIQKLELRVCFQKVRFRELLEPAPILRRVTKWRAPKTDWSKTKSVLRRKLEKLRVFCEMSPPRRQISVAPGKREGDFVGNLYVMMKAHPAAFQQQWEKAVSLVRTRARPAIRRRRTTRKGGGAPRFPRKLRIEHPLTRFFPQVRAIKEAKKKLGIAKAITAWENEINDLLRIRDEERKKLVDLRSKLERDLRTATSRLKVLELVINRLQKKTN